MDKIESFLSSYEADLNFKKSRILEEIERSDRQIDDLRKRIQEIQEAKDLSYEVFSASQAGNNGDTEAGAMKQLVSDKIHHKEGLREELLALEAEIAKVQDLDYHTSRVRSISDEDLLKKLQLISKWIPLDSHRALGEMQQLIRNIQTRMMED